MPVIAIYNPVCGDGNAKPFLDQHVLPLLSQHGKIIDTLVATEHAGHAGHLLVDFLESREGDISVVLASGDGTLHEIINTLSSTTLKGPRATSPIPRLHFALVPCGTANALYSSLFPPPAESDSVDYRLQSIRSFVESSRTLPLTLAIATLSSPPSVTKRPQVAISSVVVSTALHATILRDSESLRKDIPGTERFKVAARNNSAKWYNSYVKLLPAPLAGRVQVYDPAHQAFVDHPESDEADPIVDLHGPFAYFLSTVNVDRLEPAFRVTPLARTIPPVEATCELVLLRPLRDPSLSRDDPDARKAFVPKLWEVLSGAYKDGAHIDLRYGAGGEIVTGGNGPALIEYFRCGGWEWIPDDADEDAHILCSDGAIFYIEKGGRAVCSAATPKDNAGFAVYA
ncbi:putative diacylglycerol kinase catalytic domain [Lyophyllum shimeji]|uniref:Diacylglycerol kinase catalytic domain n=1 Tax=Lyophyllum shimeji TaxID=47721 RepID=A0A9P3PFV3_LYOSH|nr:putative diacylglycerol kinase catalytic domain [Lyophyllum shimeji]